MIGTIGKQQLTGYLLHRREYRETSYLVDLFTLELGKVSAVAKGVRGNKSERKSLLQPFQPLHLFLSGRHELKNLGQLEALQNRLMLPGKRLYCGLYINELMNRALPVGEAHPHLFDCYVSTLEKLQKGCDLEPLLREFEFSLLSETGYMLDLTQDWQSGEDIQPGEHYALVPEHGLQRVYGEHSAMCFTAESLLKIQHLEWDKASLDAAKRIARAALCPLIGTKPLKSRELFVNQ